MVLVGTKEARGRFEERTISSDGCMKQDETTSRAASRAPCDVARNHCNPWHARAQCGRVLLSRLDALLASSGRAVGTAKVELFEKLQELLSDDDVRLLAQQLRRSASLLLVSASKDDKLRKSLAKPALRACLEKPI